MMNNKNIWTIKDLINSRHFFKIVRDNLTAFLVIFVIAILYLLTLAMTKKSALEIVGVVNLAISTSNSPVFPIDTNFKKFESTQSWLNLSGGAFNLGSKRYGLVQIKLSESESQRSDEVVIALTKNNVFTGSTLYFRQGGTLRKIPLAPTTNDDKLLSTTLPNNSADQVLYLALSGSYLRGEIHILTPNEFTQYIKKTAVKNGVYVGIVTLFLLLSLLSYFIFKKSIFIKYAALLSAMFLWIAAGEGWLKSYFPVTQGLPFFTANSLGLLFFIAFAYFSYDYLKLNDQTSNIAKILKYSQTFLILIWFGYCLLFNHLNSWLYQVFYGIALISCFSVLITSFIAATRSLAKNNLQSRFYIAALSVFIFCSVISGLSISNILDIYLGWSFIKVSSLIEMCLLASGLMYWFRESMVKLVDGEVQYQAVTAQLATTQKQLTESKAWLESQQNNPILCPHIAKVVALIDKILYIKAAGNYSEVIYQDGRVVKNLLVDINLHTIENALVSKKILRCHKSYLVRFESGFTLTRRTSADYDLVLAQHRIPVGRKYLKSIRLLYNRD
ncbi:7TM diverse intracellular signaling domain-containing protein [Colwelliaceae bacterium MEBiC 14330]